MTAAEAISMVLQILALFPTVEAAIVQAIKDFKALIDSGTEVSQADIDALVDRVKTQSAAIQAL